MFRIDTVNLMCYVVFVKTELERLEHEIQENYATNMAAIEKLKKWIPIAEATDEKIASLIAVNNPSRSIFESIEELIRKSPNDFDVPTIAFRYSRLTGKSRWSTNIRRIISQVIVRLRNHGEILVVAEGKGRRSGTYRIVSAKQNGTLLPAASASTQRPQ